MQKKIQAILFDLGGVLIELDGLPIKDEWVKNPLSYTQNWITWGKAKSVIAFETGKMSAEAFPQAVIKELHLNVSKYDFIDTFTHWPKGYLQGATELLHTLKRRYVLAYYSNTNTFHLPWLRQTCDFQNYFNYEFASYEIGHFKPDSAGFLHVAKKMQIAPENILFIDDNQMNVDGAKGVGMSAYLARGIDEVKEILKPYLG